MLSSDTLALILVVAGIIIFVGGWVLHWILIVAALALVILGLFLLTGGSLAAL
jgi:hypothetical protein